MRTQIYKALESFHITGTNIDIKKDEEVTGKRLDNGDVVIFKSSWVTFDAKELPFEFVRHFTAE